MSSSQTAGIFSRIFFEGYTRIFVHIYDQNKYFFVQGPASCPVAPKGAIGPRLGTIGLEYGFQIDIFEVNVRVTYLVLSS